MAVYDRVIATAQKLIEKFGQSATVREIVDGAPALSSEPWKPTTGTVVDTIVNCVFLNEKRKDHDKSIYTEDTLIPDGRTYALIPQVPGLVITQKHVIVRGSQILNLRFVTPLEPNGVVIFWKVGIRL